MKNLLLLSVFLSFLLLLHRPFHAGAQDQPVETVEEREYRSENPHPTQYFFGPNAIGVKPGRGYYQNAMILLNGVEVGITKNISAGVGLIPAFVVGGGGLIGFGSKISLPMAENNFHMAIGGTFGAMIGENMVTGRGGVYGILTAGQRDRNISFGMTYLYDQGGWFDEPLFNVSGMFRTGETMYVITESYISIIGNSREMLLDGQGVKEKLDVVGVVSAGVRWIPQNTVFDFGLFHPVGAGRFFPLPWLSLSLPFGR